MKKILSLIFLLPLIFNSCAEGDPSSWNKSVTEVYNQTVNNIEEFEELIALDKVGDVNAAKVIQEKGTQIISDLDNSIALISEEELPRGVEEYQTSILSVLESMKSQVSIGLQFTSFTDKSSDTEVENYADKYDDASVATAKKVEAMMTAQKQFLKHFNLEQ